jgi:hypothetical protein
MVLRNKISTKKEKFKAFGKIALGTSTTVGTSITGGIIGQSLIPIPLLGAFIGGLIGGIIGEYIFFNIKSRWSK